jgi:hypothetical protein
MDDRVLTLKELEYVFQHALEYKEEYIGVRIEMPDLEKPEIIINPRENFSGKLAYYKRAYNDDLTLKSFNGIKITRFMYGCNFAEIQDYLVD